MSNFNEAPASANVRFDSPNGFEWQFTMRADSGKQLLQMMAAFEAKALADGYRPQGRRSQPAASNGNGNGNSNGYQNGGQANSNKSAAEAGSFTIVSLEYGGRSNKGDDSWRVKGGNYMTYGMMMYPEQWQASNLQMPAAGQQVNLTGWTAHHNGKKIVRIEPATQLQQPSQPAPQLSPVAVQELQVNGHKYGNGNGNGVSHYHEEIDF